MSDSSTPLVHQPPTLPDAHDLVQRYRKRARKSMGQNFLLDERVLDAIAHASGAGPSTPVLEIGSGPGSLTQALLRRGGRVIAVEKDRDAVPFLRNALSSAGERLQVIEGDILRYQLPSEAKTEGWVAAGNLPYNISTQVYFRTIDWRLELRRSVFMFQREVALRFVAEPRSKAYGILSLIGNFYHRPSYLMTVPPKAFHPSPKVHSGIVVFDARAELPLPDEFEKPFRTVVKAAFSQRRKMLPNTLKGIFGMDKPEIREVLDEIGVHAKARAEELDLDYFCALTRALATHETSNYKFKDAETSTGEEESNTK